MASLETPLEDPLTFAFSLVPKLHLGTHLLRQFHCRPPDSGPREISAKYNFAKNKRRSQVQLGNEGKSCPGQTSFLSLLCALCVLLRPTNPPLYSKEGMPVSVFAIS
jgi:hypothetical protein